MSQSFQAPQKQAILVGGETNSHLENGMRTRGSALIRCRPISGLGNEVVFYLNGATAEDPGAAILALAISGSLSALTASFPCLLSGSKLTTVR